MNNPFKLPVKIERYELTVYKEGKNSWPDYEICDNTEWEKELVRRSPRYQKTLDEFNSKFKKIWAYRVHEDAGKELGNGLKKDQANGYVI